MSAGVFLASAWQQRSHRVRSRRPPVSFPGQPTAVITIKQKTTGGDGGGADDLWRRRVCPGSFLRAANYGGRVPVDTTPGPVPVCRALKKSPYQLIDAMS